MTPPLQPQPGNKAVAITQFGEAVTFRADLLGKLNTAHVVVLRRRGEHFVVVRQRRVNDILDRPPLSAFPATARTEERVVEERLTVIR
ncbi:unnamed protein product [Soboliphyme baturini]|uniref:Robl_LC7 domain-containing protein n=1 Tax=Soboliphyme baturini TaxID=241478 RepID=A0A183J8Z4_9BILA|nr:unnamed protein product [Soboliphyme baturini]